MGLRRWNAVCFLPLANLKLGSSPGNGVNLFSSPLKERAIQTSHLLGSPKAHLWEICPFSPFTWRRHQRQMRVYCLWTTKLISGKCSGTFSPKHHQAAVFPSLQPWPKLAGASGEPTPRAWTCCFNCASTAHLLEQTAQGDLWPSGTRVSSFPTSLPFPPNNAAAILSVRILPAAPPLPPLRMCLWFQDYPMSGFCQKDSREFSIQLHLS